MSGPVANAGSSTNGAADDGTPENLRWRGFWGRLLIAVLIASACMTSAVALVDRGITQRVAKIRRVNIDVAPAPPGGANYLVIGSDTRAFVKDANDASAFGDPSSDPSVEGQRSDTLMVAHVEPTSQKTFVVSFPRDLMVDIPGYPGKTRINAAYSLGGPELVAQTLKANFDIDVNHYLEVDFESFREIVDEIGNIGVYLPGRVRDLETGVSTPYGAGCYALDGNAALAYVRSRHLEIADPNGTIVDDNGDRWRLLDIRADLDRIGRQQTFIRQLAAKAISKALSDPFLALSLSNSVVSYLTADKSLSRDDVNQLVRAFKTVDVNDPNSIRFETLPVDPDPDNPTVTLVPSADAEDVVRQLRTFGDDTPKPATVQPAQVTVRVSDATGTNVAPSVVDALAAEGFHASAVKARSTVPVSEIRYGFGQAEEAKALLAYFPDAKLVPDPAAKDAVTVVVGSSFPGTIYVPPTTTTAPPAPTVPGAPVTTEAPTTTTQPPPDPSAACPQ